MTPSKPRGWRIFVDRGGTFTDVVALGPDGRLVTRKVLSENPGRYDDAVIAGIREAGGLADDAPLSALEIEEVRVGTTVATNALLERRGARTALIVTRGFRDALKIRYQNRPKLFVRRIELPEPLYEHVIEVDERIGADGSVIKRLDAESARDAMAEAVAEGMTAAAIVLMHGYRYPEHERTLAELAREAGFTYVSTSHEASPLIRFVTRGITTVADAYLTPKLKRYTDTLSDALPGGRLFFMQSNGGLARASRFRGHNAILSGPAGGIVGAARVSESAGFKRIIAFDMGGTSTDVSHYDGNFERESGTEAGGFRLQSPTLSIHTVAAGGGSMLEFDGARFRVGPGSAGADPGPACYRKGGPLTVTDCNVMVGKIHPEFFPRIFGPRYDQPLDAETVRQKFAALTGEINEATAQERSAEEFAEGFLKIAVQNMANAIKRVSVQQGRDVTRYVLCCFGGAGGQHACLVADALGMTQVLVPALAGVLSAVGLSLAEIRSLRQHSVEAPLKEFDDDRFDGLFDPLEAECRDELQEQGATEVALTRRVHLRYRGSDTSLAVDYVPGTLLAENFEEAHLRRFGFADTDVPLEIAAVEVEAAGPSGAGIAPGEAAVALKAGAAAKPVGTAVMFSGGARHEVNVYARAELAPQTKIEGPAIITEADATTVVEPGWRAEVLERGHLLLTRPAPPARTVAVGTDVDPVMLEVFHGHFTAIAERMGAALANTAHSVNIKERFDFSCAIFDQKGGLVANAPHVPVHLGSMSESVRAVIAAAHGSMRPGDSYALNAPYRGGTHLPDITVVTPVFDKSGQGILFFVASRGHHADVGGITPGSMPSESRTIEEEGVLIDGVKIVSGGRFLESDVRKVLGAGKWPVRNPDENIADMKAQAAANATGAEELRELVRIYSVEVVHTYMRHVQDNAAESVRRVLDALKDGEFAAAMDGSDIRVAITVDKKARSATVDFTGSSSQRPDNLNAPMAVTQAAVLYVFRTLVDDDIPLNDGCFQPLRIAVPEGSLLRPEYPAAVCGGNVETSQCMVDAMFAAVGALAASQGTMNNFTFGNARFQYYETLCGGAGAGPGFDGASAVHTHMTNSRLTDAEVLEQRFPVLVEEFSIRAGSGGAGKWRGGDGVVRKIRFLTPVEASILSTRRKVAPFGLAGGGDAAPGKNYVERADGKVETLPGTATVKIDAGDVFVIETPGGGGYGRAS